MTMQRHVKLTRNSGEDTISLPAEFALSSDDVIIRKEGDRLVIEPEIARNRQVNGALLAWLATQEPLPPEDAMDAVSREGPTRPVTL
jgi:virulence-associated protein VagC